MLTRHKRVVSLSTESILMVWGVGADDPCNKRVQSHLHYFSSMSSKITPEEIKLRGSLLAKNKDLLKLHKDLVFSSILTEDEFWEDRKGLLRIQEMILRQKKGASSALVSDDLKPCTASTSDVKYVLTPTIIQTIFEQHPILQKAFFDLVTALNEEGVTKLTEREFWIEYFKSPFFTEPKTINTTNSNLLDSYYKETISESDGPQSLEESNVKVSGQCDISRSEEDHVNDYLRPESQNDSSWNALRQFNKHSLRVLQAQTSLDSPHELSIEISDLNAQSTPEMALLNVQESQMFTKSSDKNQILKITDRITKDGIKQILKDQNDKPFDATKFQLNYTKSKETLSILLERNNFYLNRDPKQSSVTVSADLSEDQLQLLNSSIEILRHFWKTVTSVAATKISAEKLAKLTRLVSVLEKMESKIKFNGNQNLVECIKQAKSKYTELNK